ncbi:MAG: sigma-70 family RNA polymerase sigma factor [Planctomycetes bacterium]|nr:sigma-70 family RNA polymerase sigma factor [Planctomycetota bacterium]
MNYAKQVEMFRNAKSKYMGFLSGVLWKLTGDKELFTEAMQNSLLQMWTHADKLNRPKAKGYIYRIALSANECL